MMLRNLALLALAAVVASANAQSCPVGPSTTGTQCTGTDGQMCHYNMDATGTACPDCMLWSCNCFGGVYNCACKGTGCLKDSDEGTNVENLDIDGGVDTEDLKEKAPGDEEGLDIDGGPGTEDLKEKPATNEEGLDIDGGADTEDLKEKLPGDEEGLDIDGGAADTEDLKEKPATDVEDLGVDEDEDEDLKEKGTTDVEGLDVDADSDLEDQIMADVEATALDESGATKNTAAVVSSLVASGALAAALFGL